MDFQVEKFFSHRYLNLRPQMKKVFAEKYFSRAKSLYVDKGVPKISTIGSSIRGDSQAVL